MVHKHSFGARKCRYERAVARGYVASGRPVGSLTTSSISLTLPSHLRHHFAQQLRVVQLAIAAHLLVASAGISTKCLGKAYQCLRQVIPSSVAGGLRRLNRAYCRVRHAPLLPAFVPVGQGLVRLLRQALTALCPANIALTNMQSLENLENHMDFASDHLYCFDRGFSNLAGVEPHGEQRQRTSAEAVMPLPKVPGDFSGPRAAAVLVQCREDDFVLDL